MPIYNDLTNGCLFGTSLCENLNEASANDNGIGVDCKEADGPIHAVVGVGVASGSPTGQSHVFVLEESDDNSTFVAISGATATVTADSESAGITAMRSMRYVRVAVDPTFTAGSSPTNDMLGVIVGSKKRM